MEKLRQKEINSFINSLNTRELRYIKKQIDNKLNKKDCNILEFTIQVDGKTEKVKKYCY